MSEFKQSIQELEDQDFVVRPGSIGDEKVVLIFPKCNLEWTRDNLIFRSSVWTYPGREPVSLSLPKFFNWNERNDLTPQPTSLNNSTVVEKVDGSALIVSRYKEHLITRTRGTLDASKLDTGFEIEMLKKMYPKAFDNEWLQGRTLIFEWVSPNNKIILNYPDLDIYLVAGIRHDGYKLETQNGLDAIAEGIDVKRPQKYSFKNTGELLSRVKEFDGKEGVCLYYNGGQDVKKIKATKYLKQHAFKYNMSENQLMDLYIDWGMPGVDEVKERIMSVHDYECWTFVEPFILRLESASYQASSRIWELTEFVGSISSCEDRKTKASLILDKYGKGFEAGLCFKILDGKSLSDRDWKKLIEGRC